MSKTDFLIVTALPEERDAVLQRLGSYQTIGQTREDPQVYFESSPSAGNGTTYGTIVLTLPEIGRVSAAIVAADAIRRWHPEYVLLVGIAGGFARNGAALGDVVLSTQVIDYELQRLSPGQVDIRATQPPLSVRLLTAAQNFLDRTWVSSLATLRPEAGEPRTIYGPIATGDKIVNDLVAIDRLLTLSPKLVGVEMEAGGVGRASHRNETNFFMIRGISDLADGHKDDAATRSWRAYACAVAAAYTMALIRSGLLAPPPQSPSGDYEAICRVVSSTASTIGRFDGCSDQIESFLTGSPMPAVPRQHRMQIEGGGIELVQREHGRVTKVITGQDLARLPADDLRYIQTWEQSMHNHLAVWETVYPQVALMTDPVAKAQVDLRLRGILSAMKQDLGAIMSFLESAGFYLDDHYQHVRHLISHV